jgi:putative nucleotidyltransferase with HDIG domain
VNLIDDDLVSVNKLVRIIENDPAISAKLLSVANSAFFGFREPARTLNTAIIRIGFDNVKNISLGISIMTVLDGGRHQKALDYRRIFNHSVAVGFIAKLLSGHFKLTVTDEIMICGLLHDIGLLILSRYFPDRYLNVLNALDSERDLLDVEKEVFDFTHADIGIWLAEKWSLPDTVLDTILYHHAPAHAQNNLKHVAIVHIADYIATLHIIKATERSYNLTFDSSCLDMLGISENDLTDVVTETKNGSLFSGLFVEL